MADLEGLLRMAEDELTQYSTTARKIEKLRRKIGIALPYNQQQRLKQELLEKKPKGFFVQKTRRKSSKLCSAFLGHCRIRFIIWHIFPTIS